MGSVRQFRKAGAVGLADLPWRCFLEDYIARKEMPAELFGAVLRLVEGMARRLPASLFSPIRIWDREGDAYRTIVVDLLDEQVRKGCLEKLYYANRTDLRIYGHLRQAVKWHLHGIADAHGAYRLALYQKVRSILKFGRTFCYFKAVRGWGLRDWRGHQWKVASAETLEDRLRAIEVPCPCGGRRQKVPTGTEIKAFLKQFLTVFGYPVDLKSLVRVAQVHFDVFDPSEHPWPVYHDEETGEDQEQFDLADPRSDFLEFETRETIEKFLGTLTERDLSLIRELFLKARRQKELVDKGYGKSSVSNDKRRLEALLSKLSLPSEAKPFVEAIFKEYLERTAPKKEAENDKSSSSMSAQSSRKVKTGGESQVGSAEQASIAVESEADRAWAALDCSSTGPKGHQRPHLR